MTRVVKIWEGRPDRALIRKAMDHPEKVVLFAYYTDRDGIETLRLISPSSWKRGKLVAMCLGRKANRTFDPRRLQVIREIPTHEIDLSNVDAEYLITLKKQFDIDQK